MNENPPESPLAIATVNPPAVEDAVARPPGALSERHHKYAEEFKTWLLGLNRHDFAQCRKVLETMTRAYFKHTVKVHSPPMKDENDISKTSDGPVDSVLRDGPSEP